MWYKKVLAQIGQPADPDQLPQGGQKRIDDMLVQQRHQIDTDGGGEEKAGPAIAAQQARLLSKNTPAPWNTPMNEQLEAVRHENVNNPLSPKEWTQELQDSLDADNNNYGGADMQHQNMQGTETGDGESHKGGGPAFLQGKHDRLFSKQPAELELQ